MIKLPKLPHQKMDKPLHSAVIPIAGSHVHAEDDVLVNGLPGRITFPYARHSSLPELRHLVKTLKPKDVWPCTYDFKNWEDNHRSIRSLFGDCCSGDVFAHDVFVEERKDEAHRVGSAEVTDLEDTQCTASSRQMISSPAQPSSDTYEPDEQIKRRVSPIPVSVSTRNLAVTAVDDQGVLFLSGEAAAAELPPQIAKRTHEEFCGDTDNHYSETEPDLQDDSQASSLSASAYEARLRAFRAARDIVDSGEWNAIGLLSTTDHHTILEEELGGP